MTRADFEQWASDAVIRILVRSPYDVMPCRCGDVNCHGWRFVERAYAGADSTNVTGVAGLPFLADRRVLEAV